LFENVISVYKTRKIRLNGFDDHMFLLYGWSVGKKAYRAAGFLSFFPFSSAARLSESSLSGFYASNQEACYYVMTKVANSSLSMFRTKTSAKQLTN